MGKRTLSKAQVRQRLLALERRVARLEQAAKPPRPLGAHDLAAAQGFPNRFTSAPARTQAQDEFAATYRRIDERNRQRAIAGVRARERAQAQAATQRGNAWTWLRRVLGMPLTGSRP